jgi:hypothetical protein
LVEVVKSRKIFESIGGIQLNVRETVLRIDKSQHRRYRYLGGTGPAHQPSKQPRKGKEQTRN